MKDEKLETNENLNKVDDAIKITITREAERILGEAVDRVNENFEGGKVNRQVVASWLLQRACNDLSDTDIKSIQSNSFNEALALAVLYKRVQETGEVPAELKELLRVYAGIDAPVKSRTKSKLTNDTTNDGVSHK